MSINYDKLRDNMILAWQLQCLEIPNLTDDELAESAEHLIPRIQHATQHWFGDVQTIRAVIRAVIRVVAARNQT
jgi:hypothetical protein